jgi:diguanylate cyclase (GGDEF)-like protein
MPHPLTSERRTLLLTDLAGRRQKRLALAALLISLAIFLGMTPYARLPLAHVPAFIPAYESALVICYLITAVLLLGQYNFARSRGILVLASGYLFTAFIAVAHTLVFPGVFAPTGLLGAGPQSSVWLYVFWHAGFPLFVLAYALSVNRQAEETQSGAVVQVRRFSTIALAFVTGAAIFFVACGLTFVATAWEDRLPALLAQGQPTPTLSSVGIGFWILSLLALFGLWRRRPTTILDLWLMIVMCAWLFEVALFVIFDTARFDLGWYAARIYGLLAAGFLLIVLLIETGTQSARLAQLTANLSVANKSLEQLSLHDALTGLANRRFFDAYLAAQIGTARRHGRSLTLIMFDADAFKAYNDTYGHQAGDECLKRIAGALQSCCRRPADMAARYGGEEFALILPEMELADALQIAQTARATVAALKIPHARSPSGAWVSISGGVATLQNEMTAERLIRQADENLFAAKHLGRNRIVSGLVQTV